MKEVVNDYLFTCDRCKTSAEVRGGRDSMPQGWWHQVVQHASSSGSFSLSFNYDTHFHYCEGCAKIIKEDEEQKKQRAAHADKFM